MEDKSTKRFTILASSIGNSLEWYDFAIYGFLAPILGRLFFPSEDPFASLLSAFGSFAIGYAARPIGGVLFGHLGDRIGRKTALVASILLMGVATTLIGLLPDHARIGAAAPFLLVILRILQGLSVGGEYTCSIVYMAENAPPQRRGLEAAFPQCGALVGFLLGSGIGALVSTLLGQEIMDSWGWRVPFLLGTVIALAGLVLRRRLPDLPLAVEAPGAGLPFVTALREHWRVIARIVALILVGGIGFYMIFVYAASYLTTRMHFTTARALDLNTLSLFSMLVVTLPIAILSDRIGRKPLLYTVALAALIFAIPLWWLMHQDAFLLILCGQLGFALIFAIAFAITPVVMAEQLPAAVRCSGVSIGYNLCLGLFGGTTPLVATYLVARTADDFMPAYYLMAAAALQLVAVFGMKDLAGKPLPKAS